MKVPGIMSTLDCEDDEELQKQSFLMNMQANRLATFIDWPFKKGCSCTPEKVITDDKFSLDLQKGEY